MILSLDFGTSSLKAALLNSECNVVHSTKAEYQYRVYNENWVELDPDAVLSAMSSAVSAFGPQLAAVEQVVYDTFSPSLVLMDKEGRALHPIITHLDRRSKEQSERIQREMGSADFQRITGIFPFIGGASITTLMWLMEHRSDLIGQTCKLGHLNTFLYKALTGLWATEPVNASMTGMFETVSGESWSEEICSAFGIPTGKLPDILPAGAAGGTLTAGGASLLGLPQGIPVALGTNDAAAAQLGAGNSRAGDVLSISGSSEMISILSDRPVVDDGYYLRRAATPGLWQIFAITASGFAVDWFRHAFCSELSEDEFYRRELPACAKQAANGPGGVRYLPYIAGDRQSLTPKTGSFEGITLQSTRQDFLAAILRDFHGPMVEVMERAGKFLTLSPVAKLTGGMVDEEFIALKRALMSCDFAVVQDCPLVGNARLALLKAK